MPVTRRDFLRGLAATALLSPLTASEALAVGTGKLVSAKRNNRGTTLELQLNTAPFPHAKSPEWTDNTVWVFVPKHFRVKDKRGLDMILHFHGHRDTAAKAMKRHRLREQLQTSRQNAILVVPQGPVNASSSKFGKLEEPRGLIRFLTELRRTLTHRNVAKELGASAVPGWARVGRLVLSAHSGGYKAVARCLEHGRFPVSEVWLFDALYGELDAFHQWLVKKAPRKHKFWCFYKDPTPRKNSLDLMARLKQADITYIHETEEGSSSRRELVAARNLFIASKLGHDSLLWRRNAFRDCCAASGFKRNIKSFWLQGKAATQKPRKLERY